MENVARARAGGISNSNVSRIERREDDAKRATSVALRLKQHDLNAPKEDKAITWNVPLSTEDSDKVHKSYRIPYDSRAEVQRAGQVSAIPRRRPRAEKLRANLRKC